MQRLTTTRLTAFVLTMSLVALGSGKLAAQDSPSDSDVRAQAKRILDEPEFRYFEHLDDSPARPESRAGRRRSSSGDGDGKQGGGGWGGTSSRRSSSRRGTSNRGNAEASSSDADADAGSGWGSSGGASGLGSVVGMIFHLLAYAVLIAVCGLILYLIVQAILNRESKPAAAGSPLMNLDVPAEDDHSPGELPADTYLARARELAAQRQYREAIAQLLLGGMSAIERAELIRHRRGLTFRDYLRVLRGRAPQYDGFKSLIGLYEPVGFGRRVASHQTFEYAVSSYEQAVQTMA